MYTERSPWINWKTFLLVAACLIAGGLQLEKCQKDARERNEAQLEEFRQQQKDRAQRIMRYAEGLVEEDRSKKLTERIAISPIGTPVSGYPLRLRAPYPTIAEIEAAIGKADSVQTHADKDISGRTRSYHDYTWKVIWRPEASGKQDEQMDVLEVVFIDDNSQANGIEIYRDMYVYSGPKEGKEFIGREAQSYSRTTGSPRAKIKP